MIMCPSVFTVPESMLLLIVKSTNDFNLLAYVNMWRRIYSFCFRQKNLHSSPRSVVFFHPRPNISLQRLMPFGYQASETDGDIQIKKRRNDENEQPHK